MNFRSQRSVLSVAWCALLFLVTDDAHGALDSGQQSKLFIANSIFESIPPIVNQAWQNLKQAQERGELGQQNVTSKLLVKDFIWTTFKPVHADLKLIDKVVLEHLPSAFLDKIIDLLELEKLQEASSLVEAKQASPLNFWKEEWVKLSSLLVQMHYRYNRIFDHTFKEGSPEPPAEDHSLLDDWIQILPNPPEQLAYRNRYYYTWKKMEGDDRGTGSEQYAETLDEVSDAVKETIATDNFERNLFVGLRQLLNYSQQIVGPYKTISNLTDPCWNGTGPVPVNGVDYRIPLYILLHILNAEMKYYVTQNLGEMFACAQFRECNFSRADYLQKHLDSYYKFYLVQMIKAFQDEADPISKAPPEAWIYRCGPEVPIENTTYARFYDFDTQFIAKEEELSLTKTCRDSCDLFDGAYSSIPCADDQQECLEIDDEFDCDGKDPLACPGEDRKQCPHAGILCTVNEISSAKVCPSSDPGRYLDWVQTDDPLFANMGNDTECHNDVLVYSAYEKPESSGITRYEPQRCEICLCTCFEPMTNDSHRYITLLPLHSDIQKNRVLVGIKFVKLQNQIHVAIADAETTYTDTVQPNTTKWIQPDFIPDPDNNPQKIFRLHREAKLILLDDLTAPPGYAITGVKFAPLRIPMDRLEIFELAFWMHVTRITVTGKLVPQDSGWIHTNNDARYRNRVLNQNLIPPNLAPNTLLPVPHPPGPKKLLYIEVESSSLKVDAGQTPLPFFDLQEVVNAESRTLVRGIGLFYKSPPGGYGGYLGFRLLPDIYIDIPNDDPKFDLRYWTAQNQNLLQEWMRISDSDAQKRRNSPAENTLGLIEGDKSN